MRTTHLHTNASTQTHMHTNTHLGIRVFPLHSSWLVFSPSAVKVVAGEKESTHVIIWSHWRWSSENLEQEEQGILWSRFVNMWLWVCVCVHFYVCACVFVSISMHVCVSASMHVCVRGYVHVCACVCVCINSCVCVFVGWWVSVCASYIRDMWLGLGGWGEDLRASNTTTQTTLLYRISTLM